MFNKNVFGSEAIVVPNFFCKFVFDIRLQVLWDESKNINGNNIIKRGTEMSCMI